MIDLSTTITGLTATWNVLRDALAARDEARITSARRELQEKLSIASAMTLSLIQTTHVLELEAQKLRTEVVEAHARNRETQRELEKRRAYTLAQPVPGIWAYMRVGDTAGAPENTAYFCATCHANGFEMPLQYVAVGTKLAYLVCQKDKQHNLGVRGELVRPTPPAL